ncbi:uncharacterized protein TEOVI_000733800 [Trypanosoma equiperdum]|uniref:BAG domain containing protein n=1 Tax=Trypanosoma equiperdum TaxID=5694 RepID=A0A1G4I8M1_TRYEQ|nr:hypothetical protein, conserved [Trypanosoma equiperdum]
MHQTSATVTTRLRSSRGEIIDLVLPRDCTVERLVNFLVNQYDYPKGTRIVHDYQEIGPCSALSDFPDGSLIIELPTNVSQRSRVQSHHQHPYCTQQQTDSPRQQGQPQQNDTLPYNRTMESAYSPKQRTFASGVRLSGGSPPLASLSGWQSPKRQPTSEHQSVGNDTRYSAPSAFESANSRPQTSHHNNAATGRQTIPSPMGVPSNITRSSFTTESESAKAADDFQPDMKQQSQPSEPLSPRSVVSLRCLSPGLKRNVLLTLPDEATLDDVLLAAVAQEPRLAGCKLVFRGKQLNNLSTKLSSCGIRSGVGTIEPVPINPDADGIYSLYFSPNEVNGVQKTMLIEIESNIAAMEPMVNQDGLTLNQRQGYYEELMRILFRTDGLNDLEDEWRLRRKQAVKRLTELQDNLKVDGVV